MKSWVIFVHFTKRLWGLGSESGELFLLCRTLMVYFHSASRGKLFGKCIGMFWCNNNNNNNMTRLLREIRIQWSGLFKRCVWIIVVCEWLNIYIVWLLLCTCGWLLSVCADLRIDNVAPSTSVVRLSSVKRILFFNSIHSAYMQQRRHKTQLKSTINWVVDSRKKISVYSVNERGNY